MTKIRPFILSGGSGTRLWPLSRAAYPKQFLNLIGEGSLFQQTCEKTGDPIFEDPTILSSNQHRFLVAEQLQQSGLEDATIILEPMGRNTAPAAAIAALTAGRKQVDQLCLLLPSDHFIPDRAAFVKAVASGIDAAKAGSIVTFGVVPDRPHTGYGYMEVESGEGIATVRRFTEKPSEEVAQEFLEQGNYLWNAGIFLFTAETLLTALETHKPEILNNCRTALNRAILDLDFVRLDPLAYSEVENISLDYAILEKAESVKCVPLDTAWSDIGSWRGMWEAHEKDADDNVVLGSSQAVLRNTHDSLVYSDGPLVALVGLSDVFVVSTDDAVLVTSKDRAEEVKELVEQLKVNDKREATFHARVHRPWGWYEGLSLGDRFQVKCIMVKPGAQLSLQSHYHRSEHWVVVSGTAEVTKGEERLLLSENQSTYIPIGERHRLANPGKIPTYLIEVQSGSYLGEDDIERFDDIYGRSTAD
ncbi:mannose-1-phosphate guanylyltransferase/mannose-6-phosphate isomerase [Methyloligella sp. 2.7D]|uniref:mannose-1-phosphate guanylyltransferase/mannose-6-phosphate isomerase n=1 Tax=unclassified Methyloligella TaxID=2625955 RepID=UPI00157CFD9B|nr:mannose-1-phosphate guanylyltransferase/mannose-6-phosphate isomerase [Methyloligella sp. GL2]QKP78186.1 mannose-1-phosphate guanylyltransferase/mannose-6-phosphate isomerase [Methyloligella sp. GL2]